MRERFVSIVGPGGIGKTTVAVSVAHKLLAGFEGAAFFVDLSVLTDSKIVLAAVASTLGFMAQAHDPLGSILAFLNEKKVLLVLDNCEHVIDTAAALAERVVSEASRTHILTTSREALGVQGEHVHLLYSLEAPPEDDGLTATDVLAYPAAELFMERAVASGYPSDLTDPDARIVARICRKLDGIALAIELVASRVGSLGIRGTAELLDSRFGLLWRGRRTARPRHETLNAMLDWSYNLLSEYEKLVLCRLSVFVGDFLLPAACFVASEEGHDADAAAAVVSLVAKSLVSTRAIGQSTNYRLLDITREYAKSKLIQRGEEDSIARRHAIFYSRFFDNEKIFQSRFGEHSFSAFSPHIGNALAVIDDTSLNTRREMLLQEALALSSTNSVTVGNNNQIRAALERALSVAEALGDQPHQLRLLAGLNLFFNRLGDLRSSRATAERGTAIARALSDPAGSIWAECMLGICHCFEGNQTEAQFHCECGLSLAAEHTELKPNYFGFDHSIRALVALARTLWLRGFSDQAVGTAQKAIDGALSREHPVSTCVALIYTSLLFLWIGDLPRARSLIEQLIAHAGRYSLEPFRAAGLALKGKLAIACDETEYGIALLRDMLKTIHEYYYLLVPTVTGALAEGLRKAGQLEEALFTIDGAITRARGDGVKVELAELLRIKSLVFVAKNDGEAAIDCLKEAIEVARSQSALAWELRSTIDLARLLSEAGQRDQARHDLAIVYDRFTEGFETKDLKVARALLQHLQS
jgi:predicted ATPase